MKKYYRLVLFVCLFVLPATLARSAEPNRTAHEFAWGKAHNGLQAGCRTVGKKRVFYENALAVQRITFEVRLRNVSDRAIQFSYMRPKNPKDLPGGAGSFGWGCTLTSDKTRDDFFHMVVGPNPQRGADQFKEAAELSIPPKSEIVFPGPPPKFAIMKAQSYQEPAVSSFTWGDKNKPGTCTIHVRIHPLLAISNNANDKWINEISTGVVKFEIQPQVTGNTVGSPTGTLIPVR